MSVSIWVRGLLLAMMLSTVTGCGYHLTNSQSGRLGAARTIWVPFFSNESISPTAQTVLRRAFYEELHALRGLNPAIGVESADLAMKARIVSYSSKAVSYNVLDQAREFSLSLTVELEIVKRGNPYRSGKGRFKDQNNILPTPILPCSAMPKNRLLMPPPVLLLINLFPL